MAADDSSVFSRLSATGEARGTSGARTRFRGAASVGDHARGAKSAFASVFSSTPSRGRDGGVRGGRGGGAKIAASKTWVKPTGDHIGAVTPRGSRRGGRGASMTWVRPRSGTTPQELKLPTHRDESVARQAPSRGNISQQTNSVAISPMSSFTQRQTALTPTPDHSSDADDSILKVSRAERFASQPVHNRYMEMKKLRPALMKKYIAEGKMDDPNKKYRLEDARDFVGECEDMCPEYERHEREYQKGLMEFEKIPGTDRVDHAKAVKRYRRSAADDEKPLPCDVRPPSVLERTLNYLVHELIPEYDLQRTYGFIRDRTRAIRKDLTLQNLRGPEAVGLFERIARYHLMCSQRLCATIDIKQEYEQLGKTLQSLMEFYDDLREEGKRMPNEAEFRAYYLLHHAFNQDVQSSFERKFINDPILLDPHMQLAIRLRSLLPRLDLHHDDEDEDYTEEGDTIGEGGFEAYGLFFKIIKERTTPYLLACAAHPHFLVVRRHAYRHMDNALYVFPNAVDTLTPVATLVEQLGYDNEEDAIVDLEYYDIPIRDVEGRWYAEIGKVKITGTDGKSQMVPGKFNDAKRVSLQPRVANRLLEGKLGDVTDADVIDGNVPEMTQEVPDYQGQSSEVVAMSSIPGGVPTFGQVAATTARLPSSSVGGGTFSNAFGFVNQQQSVLAGPSSGFFGQGGAFMGQASIASGQATRKVGQGVLPLHPVQVSQLPFPSLSSSITMSPQSQAGAWSSFGQQDQPPQAAPTSGAHLNIPNLGVLQQPSGGGPPTPAGLVTRKPDLVEQRTDVGLIVSPSLTVIPLEAQAGPQLPRAESQPSVVPSFTPPAVPTRPETPPEPVIPEDTELLERERKEAEARARIARQKSEASKYLAARILAETIHQCMKELAEEVSMREDIRAKWRLFAHRLPALHAKEQAKREAVRTFLNLVGSEVAPPRVSFREQAKALMGTAGTAFTMLGSANRDEEMARATDEVAALEQQLMERIDLADLTYPILRENHSTRVHGHTLHYKLCITTPTFHLLSTDKQRLPIQWLKAKFGGANNAMPTLANEVGTEELQRTRVQDGEWDCWAVVRHVTDALPEEAMKTLHGINAAIFQFDLFGSGKDKGFYFNEERSRFVNFINALPKQTLRNKIPLLFVYWSVPELPRAELETRVRQAFQLSDVQVHGPISDIGWLEIQYTDKLNDLIKANEYLVEAVEMLVARSQAEPEMNWFGMDGKDVLGESMLRIHFREHSYLLQSRFPHRMAHIPERNIPTFNTLIRMYNAAMEVYAYVLAGPDVEGLNYPPYEFATPGCPPVEGGTNVPLNWNSMGRLKEMRMMLAQFVLPPLRQHGRFVVDEYVDQLGKSLDTNLRGLWLIYCTWISDVCDTVPAMRDTERRSLFDAFIQLFEGYSRTAATVAVRFPFGELAEVVTRAIFIHLDTQFTAKFRIAPYPRQLAVYALEGFGIAMTKVIDNWYQEVMEWLRIEAPEYESEDETSVREDDGVSGDDVKLPSISDGEVSPKLNSMDLLKSSHKRVLPSGLANDDGEMSPPSPAKRKRGDVLLGEGEAKKQRQDEVVLENTRSQTRTPSPRHSNGVDLTTLQQQLCSALESSKKTLARTRLLEELDYLDTLTDNQLDEGDLPSLTEEDERELEDLLAAGESDYGRAADWGNFCT
ncbi:uncharacterized protein SPPG_01240 [Spizellomyces punctatus DAOM BR117]|uniref:Uncharacterized protein n=1 Tax=Spizellomyces punctatus (strain DAOM BR117) TaxID=645134 RepID=A0A0L0HRP8_SPIPD|nr:uncharacterized protein SPPG_01240 [Spizellomyces punctatus DAOM BR117]KND03783.1 hypothetical protein SPPG_01240 [Spizellomyces punctatus DAOM BR117]|eukprot:XP_016611822.1 hypothetical protein SPPG_01240 [Spizellomyces punctatus DAOM BR117]